MGKGGNSNIDRTIWHHAKGLRAKKECVMVAGSSRGTKSSQHKTKRRSITTNPGPEGIASPKTAWSDLDPKKVNLFS